MHTASEHPAPLGMFPPPAPLNSIPAPVPPSHRAQGDHLNSLGWTGESKSLPKRISGISRPMNTRWQQSLRHQTHQPRDQGARFFPRRFLLRFPPLTVMLMVTQLKPPLPECTQRWEGAPMQGVILHPALPGTFGLGSAGVTGDAVPVTAAGFHA